jgi:hypothetical protein
MDEEQINPHKDLEYGLKELCEALPGYKRAERYFRGTIEEKYTYRPLAKILLTGSENDFNVNLAGRVVTAVTDRLGISALNVTENGGYSTVDAVSNTTQGSSGGDNVVRALNELVWHDNELDQEAPDIHEKATYYGDCYLFVWPTEDAEGVEIYMNNPKTTRVFYESDSPRKKRFALKRWVDSHDYVRVNLYYPEWVVKFISTSPGVSGENAGEFRVYNEDPDVNEDGVMPNPIHEIPIYHFRTARPYGRPEHFNAYGPQDAITKLVRTQMTVTDFAAFPQRYALTETNALGDDDIDWGDDPTQSPEDLNSQLTSRPGNVWVLDKMKEVGQFTAADVDQILRPLDKFIELMASTTGTPLTYLHKVRGTSSTPLSGESQKQTDVMLIKKIEARQRSYGATWREALSAALRILGYDATVTVQWEPLQFQDDKETWEATKFQQEAGVPRRQTLLERGYTEAMVESWGYTEEEPNGPVSNEIETTSGGTENGNV